MFLDVAICFKTCLLDSIMHNHALCHQPWMPLEPSTMAARIPFMQVFFRRFEKCPSHGKGLNLQQAALVD